MTGMIKEESIIKRATIQKRKKDTGEETYNNNKNHKLHLNIKITAKINSTDIQKEVAKD